jgi:broad specificity phosphatase PhoE
MSVALGVVLVVCGFAKSACLRAPLARAHPRVSRHLGSACRGMQARKAVAESLTTYDVYPMSELDSLQRAGRDVCTIHMIRHAEGTHNVARAYRDPSNLDARLTARGEEQCAQLAANCSAQQEMLDGIELVVTSPLTRCVQTALLSLPMLASGQHVKFLAHEGVRETVNYVCDQRRLISQISAEFPRVDFSLMSHDHDDVWQHYEARLGTPAEYDGHRESAELCAVAERGRGFLTWLNSQPQRTVIVSSHSAFLRCFFSFGQSRGVPSMPAQTLDRRERHEARDVPVVRYCGDDSAFEGMMRADYSNCELRSFLVVF